MKTFYILASSLIHTSIVGMCKLICMVVFINQLMISNHQFRLCDRVDGSTFHLHTHCGV